MFNDFEDENPNNIPDIFRGLTKTKIFEIVNRDWVLPSKYSRCTSKQYLYNVHAGTVFRVSKEILLNFEANLTVEETLKSAFYNIGFLLRKLELLQAQLGRPILGFQGAIQPDDEWFSRILRYLDQYNILGGFKQRVRNAQPPRCHSGRM